MTKIVVASAALALWALATGAVAQTNPHAGHGGHGSHSAHATPASPKAVADLPSVKAYQAANDKMHKDMSISFTGNPDVDFVKGMIPHHQGAIDMAKVVLEHGKDARVRRLARNIIRTQEAEIRMMQAWIKQLESRKAK